MDERETNARGEIIRSLLYGVRENCAIKAVLAEFHHGMRPRPIPKRLCFGYSLDLTGSLPPNFPITPSFPCLHSPLNPPPTMQKPPNAADFCPPPDAADL
jgi:hypothetical protein